MTRHAVIGALLVGLFVALAAPALAQDRVSATEKGSLVVFNKVEIRWDAAGNLIQDTFLDLTNDYPGSVAVQMYFVNGDPGLDAVYDINGDLVERAHPGCNWVDNQIALTANEPCYWSALTGLPKGVSPFTVLDPSDDPQMQGRPAQDGSLDRVLRGFVLAWAVNANGEEIRWNHLKGDAMIIHFNEAAAWEYNAWTFQSNAVAHGAPLLPPYGQLDLDGIEYERVFDMLLMDFYAVGGEAFAYDPAIPGVPTITPDVDLTLLPMIIDLRQDGQGPVTTKAKFDIWNQNEVKFSGTERCINCWDQALLSMYDVPNHFLRQHLQTNKGKARIDGMASIVCDEYDGMGSPVVISEDAPLLAVRAMILDFDGGADMAMAGINLVGMGEEPEVSAGVIMSDVIAPPPELFVDPLGAEPVEAAPAAPLTGSRR